MVNLTWSNTKEVEVKLKLSLTSVVQTMVCVFLPSKNEFFSGRKFKLFTQFLSCGEVFS